MNPRRRGPADRPLALALVALAAVAALYIALDASARGGARGDVTLLVADLRGHALLLVNTGDPRDPRVTRRIALPGAPHELVRLADGRVAASMEQQGALAVVDVRSGSVEAVEIGGLPHGLAVADGVLYVTDRSAGAVRRLRVDGWDELAPLPAGSLPHAVAALPDGRIAVASAGDNALRIGGRMLAVSALPEAVALSPDGRRVAVAGAFGGLVEVFALDGSSLQSVALGGRPVRLLFSPSGDELAVALSAEGVVAIVDRDGATRRVAVDGVPDGLAFDASGSRLFVSDIAHGALSVIDVASGRATRLAVPGESAGALLVLVP